MLLSHKDFGIVSPKLDKLLRRKDSTSEILKGLLCSGVWAEDELDKALDKELKASDEYFTELQRVVNVLTKDAIPQ